MAIKAVVAFGGIAPRVNPSLLADNIAQVANNCVLWHGDLRPLSAPTDVVTPVALGSAIASIYRIGQDLPETQYWLRWATDVDVVRGMIADDTSERTYYTGDGAPKVTDLTLATQGGTNYPVNAWTLGIPAPLDAPVLVASSATAPVETRVYVYTYVSAWGEEGAPSPPTKVVVAESGSVTLSNMSGAPAGNFNIAWRRIYRSEETDDGSAIYRFVKEIAITASSTVDNLAATDLGEEMTTLDYHMPPATMKGLVALPNGIMGAFDGYDLLLCEPYKPYAYPTKYRLTTDYPIVGLGVFGSSIVVCTTGVPYLVSGVHPETMSMEKVQGIQQACVSKRSITSSDDGVVYASPDGLVYIGASGAQLLTKERFTRKDWQALNPATIDAYWHDGRYIALHAGGGFIMDATEAGSFTTFDDISTAGHVDLLTDALYLCIGGVVKKFNNGANKSFTWRSKRWQSQGHVPPGFAMVDADVYPVTFKMYADGVLTQTNVVTDQIPFPLDFGNRHGYFEFELTGTGRVRYAGIAHDYDEFPIG